MPKMYNRGLHEYRLANNPEERRFARAWNSINQSSTTVCPIETLTYLLGDGQQRADVSDRDRVVAATVIQWLGSSVGQSWLEELGYKREGNWR